MASGEDGSTMLPANQRARYGELFGGSGVLWAGEVRKLNRHWNEQPCSLRDCQVLRMVEIGDVEAFIDPESGGGPGDLSGAPAVPLKLRGHEGHDLLFSPCGDAQDYTRCMEAIARSWESAHGRQFPVQMLAPDQHLWDVLTLKKPRGWQRPQMSAVRAALRQQQQQQEAEPPPPDDPAPAPPPDPGPPAAADPLPREPTLSEPTVSEPTPAPDAGAVNEVATRDSAAESLLDWTVRPGGAPWPVVEPPPLPRYGAPQGASASGYRDPERAPPQPRPRRQPRPAADPAFEADEEAAALELRWTGPPPPRDRSAPGPGPSGSELRAGACRLQWPPPRACPARSPRVATRPQRPPLLSPPAVLHSTLPPRLVCRPGQWRGGTGEPPPPRILPHAVAAAYGAAPQGPPLRRQAPPRAAASRPVPRRAEAADGGPWAVRW